MKHRALVTNVTPEYIDVTLEPAEGGCDACALASGCCSGGGRKGAPVPPSRLRVSVEGDDAYALKKGEMVTLEATNSSIAYATVVALAVPVVLLLGTVACAAWLFPDNGDTTLGAALGLVVVAAYFLALKIFRVRVGRRVRWRLVN